MKTCFKCGERKPLSSFYKHPQMADGHVNKCKECNKRDVRENRKDKVEYYRNYDIKRGSRQDKSYLPEYRSRYPNKYAAHQAISYAVRSGKMCAQPCEVCGKDGKTHAHHDDYSFPLNVRWLCPPCHKAWHIENGEGKNA